MPTTFPAPRLGVASVQDYFSLRDEIQKATAAGACLLLAQAFAERPQLASVLAGFPPSAPGEPPSDFGVYATLRLPDGALATLADLHGAVEAKEEGWKMPPRLLRLAHSVDGWTTQSAMAFWEACDNSFSFAFDELRFGARSVFPESRWSVEIVPGDAASIARQLGLAQIAARLEADALAHSTPGSEPAIRASRPAL